MPPNEWRDVLGFWLGYHDLTLSLDTSAHVISAFTSLCYYVLVNVSAT